MDQCYDVIILQCDVITDQLDNGYCIRMLWQQWIGLWDISMKFQVTLNLIAEIDWSGISSEIAIIWISLDITDHTSTLI